MSTRDPRPDAQEPMADSGVGAQGPAALDDTDQALRALHDGGRADLAVTLAQLVAVVAVEAGRSSRFAGSLERALAAPAEQTGTAGAEMAPARRPHRRAAGALDPFAVYGEVGEDGLTAALAALELEQLRDIIAEHAMDHDRLAMKWKDPNRVVARIVERVAARAAKGSAFRGPTN